jgi:hypothetical protein
MQQQLGNAGTNGIGQNVPSAFGGIGNSNNSYPGQQYPSPIQPQSPSQQSPQ